MKFSSWNGFQKKGLESGDEQIVYITKTGLVYHEDYQCTYLQLSVRFIPYADLDGIGTKTAEDIINVTNVSMEVQWQEVYITNTGASITTHSHCGGLNRTIYAVQKSRVIRKRGMFTMYEIGEICFGGYLCVVSMWDIRKREIPVWLIAAGGILSASLGYFHGKNSTGTNGHRRACGRSVSSDQQIDTGGFRIW